MCILECTIWQRRLNVICKLSFANGAIVSISVVLVVVLSIRDLI